MEILFIVIVSFLCLLILAILAAFAFSRRLRKRISERIIRQRIDADETLQAAKADLKNVLTERTQALHDCEVARQALETVNARRTAAMASIKKDIDHYAELSKQKIDSEIKEWTRSAQEAANFDSHLNQQTLLKAQDEIVSQTSILSSERDQLVLEIEDYKKQRSVINEEIQRSRAIKENQSFYQIHLDDAARHDIGLLQSIKSQFSKFDILDKIIYDNYVKSPADEMIKRVTAGHNICGIYKVTRLSTGEIYVGQSVNIPHRWQQHVKSCYHCGTISHSTFHTTLERDGIENFTWEVLEEVPKDKLTEREKFWIEFYDSKRYGLNMREG